MAWAFATLNHQDEKLFAVLASTAEQRLKEFYAQDIANTVLAFATINHRDE